MAPGKPYSVFKRGRFYYAQFRLPNGKFSTARTTKQTRKGDAERWCIEQLSAGPIITRRFLTLEEYTRGFFAWNGAWATDKRVRGLRVSPRHCQEREDLMRRFILPQLGDRRLLDIDRGVIKAFRNGLHDRGYAGGTINHILSCLKTILETAEDEGLIRQAPRIDRAANRPKHKGILEIEEVQRVFSIEWSDRRAYAGNLLAATTGLRLGELMGLVLADVRLDEGFLHVRRSWDTRLKMMNETTKTGRARNIFVPENVREELARIRDLNPYTEAGPEAFLFFGHRADRPMDGNAFIRALYEALARIGIDDAERRRRNITFHSWRHWLNSLLINAKIPLQKIQSITGHLTPEMSQHYYQLDDMADVLLIQQSIFTRGTGRK